MLHWTTYKTLYFDKDAVIYCTRECAHKKDCVTFDSQLVVGLESCYLSPAYSPLIQKTDSIHWEYRRLCVTSMGKGMT